MSTLVFPRGTGTDQVWPASSTSAQTSATSTTSSQSDQLVSSQSADSFSGRSGGTAQGGVNLPTASSPSRNTGALNAALAQIRSDSSNPANKTQTTSLPDGKKVLFENIGGKAQFSVFNADGSQFAPSSGWQQIDPNVNQGKGSLITGTNSVLNFDMQGITGDAVAKNPGTPLGVDAAGQIAVGGGSAELSSGSIEAAADNSLSGASLADQKVNLFPTGTPTSADVHQGGLGDCYLDATMAALASTPKGQQTIQNMIKPGTAEGTYDVKMYAPDGSPVTITVDSKFETQNGSNIAEHNADGTANWASVLESAYAKYNDQYHVSGATGAGIAGIDQGSSDTNKAVMALTGNPGQSSISIQKLPQAQLAQTLTQHFSSDSTSAGAGMTAGSAKEQTLPDGVHVVGPHAYTVVGFDPATQTVTVRNPWGSNDGKNSDGTPTANDGTIKLSLTDFQTIFDSTSSWDGVKQG